MTVFELFWAQKDHKRLKTHENARRATVTPGDEQWKTFMVCSLSRFTNERSTVRRFRIYNPKLVSWSCQKLQRLMDKTLLRKQSSKSWGKKYRPRSALELYFRIFNCILLDHKFSWVKNKMILYSPYECFLHYVHQHHLRN
jgi:hypothetical protein